MSSPDRPIIFQQTTVSSDPSWMEDAFRFFFSYVVLAPVAVIIAGKLAAQGLRLSGQNGQLFQVKIPAVVTIRASNQEVTFGFTFYLICLLVAGLGAGRTIHQLFVERFGVDPGQFTSLCVFSSLMAITSSALMLAVIRLSNRVRSRSERALKEKYRKVLEELKRRGPLDHPAVGPAVPKDGKGEGK
ncbi:hypothetical protein [Umezawaea endophytica]|uniref:hypothetical protein n=1 Tax=Umezawaea endophytica TaxID=1654476 RepID=UPI0036DF8C4D